MATLAAAIVGCGTAGLASALFLHAAGVEVTLFEQFAAPRPVGAGILLQPTGLAVLSELDLLKRALERGARIDHIVGTTVSGRKVLDVGYDRLWHLTPSPKVPPLKANPLKAIGPDHFGLGIHRGTLFELLHGEVLRRGIPIRSGCRIVDAPQERSRRSLVAVDGTRYGLFDLVVDASGVQSAIRQQRAEVRLDRVYSYGAVWGVVEVAPDDPNGATLWQRYNGTSCMLGLLPIGRKPGGDRLLAALFWSVRRDRLAAFQQARLAAWQKDVLTVAPETASLIDQFKSLDQLTIASYSDVVLRRPPGHALLIIGDAAHATSPQLGQGANHALMDASALGRVIVPAIQGTTSLTEALQTYNRLRRDQIRFYQRASRWLTPVFQSDSKAIGWLRDGTLGPLCRMPWVRTEMALTLAGLKTGICSAMEPAALQNAAAFSPSVSLPEPDDTRAKDAQPNEPDDLRRKIASPISEA